MGKRILIVDDEPLLVKGMKYSLEQEGYEVSFANDGEEAIKMFKDEDFGLIVLDLMLPKKDGFEVCKEIREVSDIPIIMLTAKGEDMTKIFGLEIGADDYLTKPFNILELKARIKAIFRRTEKKETGKYPSDMEVGEFKINVLGRKIFFKGEEINLTGKEFDLFLLLASNPGKIFSREELLEKIWGYEYYGDLRTVDVHVRRLREKIEKNSSSPSYIMTKWGAGYYFKENKA